MTGKPLRIFTKKTNKKKEKNMKKTNNTKKIKMAARTTTAPTATPKTGGQNIVKNSIMAFTRKNLEIMIEYAEDMEPGDRANFIKEITDAAHTVEKASFARLLRFLGIIDRSNRFDRGRLETVARLFDLMQRTGRTYNAVGALMINYRAVNAALKATDDK